MRTELGLGFFIRFFGKNDNMTGNGRCCECYNLYIDVTSGMASLPSMDIMSLVSQTLQFKTFVAEIYAKNVPTIYPVCGNKPGHPSTRLSDLWRHVCSE